ncbi:MAG: DUF4234 domain-containing protein [bacterium]|nr:DUF4234 domain-containing protein [bacterium]
MYCKNCGSFYEDETAGFCFRCGTPKGQGSSFCDGCGSPVNEGQATCMNCGKPTGNVGGYTNTQQGAYNNFQQTPPPQQPPVEIKYRSIPLCIIFSIITCGFYGIYWFVTLTDDTNALSGDYKTSGGMAFLWSILTCGIYTIYWAYRQGEKLDYAKQSRGIPSSNSGILYLILQLVQFGFIGNCLMQNEINKFATTD